MELDMHGILGIITILIICVILGNFSIIKYAIIGFILIIAVFFSFGLAWNFKRLIKFIKNHLLL